jgi:DNA-binding transcriptional regulator YiaG
MGEHSTGISSFERENQHHSLTERHGIVSEIPMSRFYYSCAAFDTNSSGAEIPQMRSRSQLSTKHFRLI